MRFVIPVDVDVTMTSSGSYELHSNLWNSRVEIYDKTYFDELESIISNGTTDVSSELGTFMVTNGLLEKENYVPKYIDIVHNTLSGILRITIMPTEACNFRCPYCYEKHTAKVMSEEIITAIKGYLRNNAGLFKQIHLDWFGGEPTLCKEQVIDVSSFTTELRQLFEFDFQSSMTTNGYLLELQDFLGYYDAGITNYQITIDGWHHDKTRPLANGGKTLDRILKNLGDISQLPHEQYKFKIIIRHNVLNGDMDFTWYDHLKKLFGNDERFEVLVKPVGDYGGDEVKKLNILKKSEINNCISKHIEYIEKIGLKSFNRRGKSIADNMCYAALEHSYIFRTNGNIEKCTVALGHPQNIVGSVKLGEVVINSKMNAPWHTIPLNTSCIKCEYMISCMNSVCPKAILIDEADNVDSYCIKMKRGVLQ